MSQIVKPDPRQFGLFEKRMKLAAQIPSIEGCAQSRRENETVLLPLAPSEHSLFELLHTGSVLISVQNRLSKKSGHGKRLIVEVDLLDLPGFFGPLITGE